MIEKNYLQYVSLLFSAYFCSSTDIREQARSFEFCFIVSCALCRVGKWAVDAEDSACCLDELNYLIMKELPTKGFFIWRFVLTSEASV